MVKSKFLNKYLDAENFINASIMFFISLSTMFLTGFHKDQMVNPEFSELFGFGFLIIIFTLVSIKWSEIKW